MKWCDAPQKGLLPMVQYLRDGSPHPVVLKYGLAIVSVALATSVTHFDSARPVVSTVICALLLTAWYGGAGPGLLAWGLSVLATAYFFIPVLRNKHVDVGYLPSFLLFALSALLAVAIAIAQRHSTDSLRVVRDELNARLSELAKMNTTLQNQMAERERAEQSAMRSERELRE